METDTFYSCGDSCYSFNKTFQPRLDLKIFTWKKILTVESLFFFFFNLCRDQQFAFSFTLKLVFF